MKISVASGWINWRKRAPSIASGLGVGSGSGVAVGTGVPVAAGGSGVGMSVSAIVGVGGCSAVGSERRVAVEEVGTETRVGSGSV